MVLTTVWAPLCWVLHKHSKRPFLSQVHYNLNRQDTRRKEAGNRHRWSDLAKVTKQADGRTEIQVSWPLVLSPLDHTTSPIIVMSIQTYVFNVPREAGFFSDSLPLTPGTFSCTVNQGRRFGKLQEQFRATLSQLAWGHLGKLQAGTWYWL